MYLNPNNVLLRIFKNHYYHTLCWDIESTSTKLRAIRLRDIAGTGTLWNNWSWRGEVWTGRCTACWWVIIIHCGYSARLCRHNNYVNSSIEHKAIEHRYMARYMSVTREVILWPVCHNYYFTSWCSRIRHIASRNYNCDKVEINHVGRGMRWLLRQSDLINLIL